MTPADDRVQAGRGDGEADAAEDVDAAATEKPPVEEGDESTNDETAPQGDGPAARPAGGDMVQKMAQMNRSS
jgi:hypothetical protein